MRIGLHDNALIPFLDDNTDYQKYLEWVAEGNTPTLLILRVMQRPDPMIAAKPGAQDVQAMAARTLWLEELYFLDGRDQITPSIWSVHRSGSQVPKLEFN